jgi:hypothetical protein
MLRTDLASSLFSLGLRRAIALYLRDSGVSLGDFVFAVAISTHSLTLVPHRRKWRRNALSLGVVALIGVQTTG